MHVNEKIVYTKTSLDLKARFDLSFWPRQKQLRLIENYNDIDDSDDIKVFK